MSRTITIAHSPDADDAFMFAGLAMGAVGTAGYTYEHTLCDIQQLNEWAKEGRFDMTAISVHAYAYVHDKYAIMRSGASMGEATYGPMVVARTPMTHDELRKTTIAVPGKLTSAYLELQLALGGDIKTTVMPFNHILQAVRDGKADAGLLIHEGQLTFTDAGLCSVLELYRWWDEKYHLPLPLGVNGLRRALPDDVKTTVAKDLRASIEFALTHRGDALAHARQYARDLNPSLVDRFVGMYVNQRTVQMGAEEERAITQLLGDAASAGLIPSAPAIEWVPK